MLISNLIGLRDLAHGVRSLCREPVAAEVCFDGVVCVNRKGDLYSKLKVITMRTLIAGISVGN